jgi:hypothetical protein
MTDPTNEPSDLERGVTVVDTEPEPIEQGRSLVVVIGINEYVHQQKLKNAVQDAIGLQQTLIDKLGFSAPIPPLLNEAATRGAIFSLIEDRLYEVVEENDSLIVFFAGHGQTRVRKVGEKTIETGYLIPVDATQSWSDYVEIDTFLKNLSALPARHILVILDSCHSGFALGQAVNEYRGTENYEKALNSKLSRRVITSARRDELALDSGPIAGHSLFTGTLIDGFNWGKADIDGNGLITSSELGLFVQQQVAKEAKLRRSEQTPDFGSFHLDDRGEMVISLRDQSFDKLKARAFSALQSGKFVTFKELVKQLILLKPSSPEALYLEYRLMIFEEKFERANAVINELYQLNLVEGRIPFSSNVLWELKNIFPYWTPVLKIDEIESSLDITVLKGKNKETLEFVHEQTIGEVEGYFVENGALLQICLTNTRDFPLYVFAIQINPSGFINPTSLLNPSIMLNGLIPGVAELSYLFLPEKEAGVGEIRFFTSPQRLDWFAFPPKSGAKGLLEPINGSELQNIKVRTITYSVDINCKKN